MTPPTQLWIPPSFCRRCRAGSLDRSADNATKFAVFRDNRGESLSRKQGAVSRHFEPNGRFVQFLERHFELGNEVRPAFGATRLAVVGSRSGSGSEHLTANVPALRGSGQLPGQAHDGGGERDPAFFK